MTESAEKKRSDLIAEMERCRLVAVVRSASAKEANETVAAVAEGGIRFIEITLTVPDAFSVIRRWAGSPGIRVGAGTVLSADQAEGAIAAGAEFVVSPTLELDLVPLCHRAGVACVTGAATATEILAAVRGAADIVKLFPADCLGGPNFVRQLLGPLPDVRFMVSGGVDERNVQEYIRLGVTGIVLGSAFLNRLIRENGPAALSDEARRFVRLVREVTNS